MRTLGMVVVGLLCTGVLMTTQATVSARAKTVKGEVTLVADLQVGSTVLKAGDYQVTADGSKITFQELYRSVDDNTQRVDTKVKPVSVSCSTKPLTKKSDATQLDTTSSGSGPAVLKGLTIQGSDVSFNVTN